MDTTLTSVRCYLCLIFMVLMGVTLNAKAQGIYPFAHEYLPLIHFDIPDAATAKLSLANLGGPSAESLGNCDNVEAGFVVVGVIPDHETAEVLNGDSNSGELELLYQETFQLKPGQVKPFTVKPSFPTESLIFATYTRPEQKHCLSQSAVSVSSPLGDFSFVGGNADNGIGGEAGLIGNGGLGGDGGGGGGGQCCACAPVCACGICD